jgi:diguanylate cyclase (GGDEF)-like protein/PAS domain S-box-containing protein
MDDRCMTDEFEEKINPFRILDQLDASVDELDSLLSLGEFNALQLKRHQQIESDCRERLQAQLDEERSSREEMEKSLKEREWLFRKLVRTISEVFWIATSDGKTLSYISDNCEEVWGRTSRDFYQNKDLWLDSIVEQDREKFSAAIRALLEEGLDSSIAEIRITHTDSCQRDLICRMFAVLGRDGIRYPAGVIEDVTQSRLQDTELLQTISLLRATLDSTTDGILVLDTAGDVVDYNSQFTEIWSITPEIIDNMNFQHLLEHVNEQLQTTESLSINDDSFTDKVLLTKTGRHIECSLRSQKLGEKIYGMLWSCRDITGQMKAQKLIQYQASYDQLTSLPNRRLLQERLELSISRCKRYGRIGALLFLDLDNFKTINDTLGHPVGDDLLSEAANRLKNSLRQEDTAARLGGDEFVLLLSEFEAPREQVSAQANSVAEKVLETLTRPYEIQGHRLYVTASIGITLFPGEGDTASEVLKQADTAMYRAKEAGRNTFRFYFANMQEATQARLYLQNDLHRALENEEFHLFWLPLFDLAGKVVGAEALLRWLHPERGWILPDQFIRLAEESGLMRTLGDWVLNRATGFLKTLEDEMPQAGSVYVAVNIGLHQFQQVDFASRVIHFINTNSANPARFVIELREDILVGNLEIIQEKMYELKRLGVRFSIDDFGTGLSSLAHLKKLPLDEVKIDRSFINDIIRDPQTVDIVEAMISMAGKLGLGVVAEGVETHKEREFLSKKGCKRFQGIFYCEPLSTDEFWEFLLDQVQDDLKPHGMQSTFDGF